MKKRIYRIVKEKCGIPQVGTRWALVVTMIAATLTVGVALAQRRPARFEVLGRDERIAAEQQERHALAEAKVMLEHRAQELKVRLDQVKMELAELEESGKGESERARALRLELRELERVMGHLEREMHELEGRHREHEMHSSNVHQPRNEILRRLEELSRETEFLLQGLADQRIGRNDETNMLYNRMRELNEQMRQVRQQLGRQLESPDRRRRELDELGLERDRDRRIREIERQEFSLPMMLKREELREKARQIELELEELGNENPDRAQKLHTDLRAIHEKIAQIESELSSSRVRGAMRDLQEQARRLEHRLQELGDSHPDQAHELRKQLDQIHKQMQRSRRELDRFEHPWPRGEDPMLPGGELHRARLMVQREQIQVQIRELELLLRELNEQDKAESEEARFHQKELRDLQELLRETEKELRKSEPGRAREQLKETEKLLDQLKARANELLVRGKAELLDQLKAAENELRKREAGRTRERGREDLEREVQNLRKQMDGMNEQMSEMRELIKRLLEKRETPESL